MVVLFLLCRPDVVFAVEAGHLSFCCGGRNIVFLAHGRGSRSGSDRVNLRRR